jgi:hypothetical protein
MIATREVSVKYRMEGLSAVSSLLKDLTSTDEKARVLIGLIEVIHSYSDAHYQSDLSGICTDSLTRLSTVWQALSTSIVAECSNWLAYCSNASTLSTSTIAKQEAVIRALLCGLAVLVQDFRPSDTTLIRDSGLMGLLAKATQCPHSAVRSLSMKWTEIVFHRCCINAPLPETSNGNDLLPLLLEVFRSKVSSVADSNIPKLAETKVFVDDTNPKALHWILDQTILCDSAEPGFVFPHEAIPINHTLCLWVWRPLGVSNGTLLVKSGPVKDGNNIRPWSR